MLNKDQKRKVTITVCTGTGGIAAGGLEVLEAFQEALSRRDLPAEGATQVHKVGCRGFCAKDVLVDVTVDDRISTYQFVTPDMVPRIVEEHIVGENPVKDWLVGEDYDEFHGHQQKLILANCGRIDPESIEAYLETGGYEATGTALDMQPEEVIDAIKKAGLRGRGGAGFPTGYKWESCREAEGEAKYVICNADEGDPGAFMDRSIIEGNPHAVIEGMIIGAYAIGSHEGYVYIRAEYPLAVKRLRIALEQAREKGFLGRRIIGRPFDFDIKVVLGAGAFVCGEATALMTSIEDKAGEPRPKYVHTTEKGLWGQPSNLNNVETWANVPLIIKNGADWYARIGSEKSKGTKIFSLVGKINRTGLVEVPMGMPLRKIIYDIGGGIPNGKRLKAVQTGGPSGGCIPADLIDLPVDFENLYNVGSIMGSGGMIVMDEDTCMVDMAKYFISFCADESCGQCTPCREGLEAMKAILTEITEGRGKEEHLQQLEDLSDMLIDASLCGLGKSAPNPVISTLRYFREEYLEHIYKKHCPAGVCGRLVPVQCQMACPAGIDVPSYVALIAHGRFDEAVQVMREDNPFPWVCGLVCPAPCERQCQRGTVDTPISIRALKAFASKSASEGIGGGYASAIKRRRSEKVAIVGSGPAGLSAAYYLAVEGYDVTVFESLSVAGGMLRVGIPPHRLPKEILDREIAAISAMGVKIRTNTPLGPGLSIRDLFDQEFEAIYLAIGAHKPLPLGIKGEDAAGVVQGVTYLKSLNLGEPLPAGERTVVIGGGNVAVDVARSAVRSGAGEVTILYRRTRDEMPAYASEIEEALEEGVRISYLAAPEEIMVRDQKVAGVACVKMRLGEPDASGRRRPLPIEGTRYVIDADLVIPAIGQVPDVAPFDKMNGLAFEGRGNTIKVDHDNFATSIQGVFAGGDVVTGPATVIEAIASGKRAALAMDAFIRGVEMPKAPPVPRRRRNVATFEVSQEQLDRLKRPEIPLLSMDRRTSTFEQVELGLSNKTARDEAKRCLRCDLAS